MNSGFWDGIETILAEQIYEARQPVSLAVQEACRAFPNAPIQCLILAMASIATVLENEWLKGPLDEQIALMQIFKEIVELSVDLASSEIIGHEILLCRDFLDYRNS